METGDVRHLVPPGRWERRDDLDLWRTPEDLRLFFVVTANPDDPAVRVPEAWDALLASLPHGCGVRFLQVVLPDETPRRTFVEHLTRWQVGGNGGEVWLRELQDFLLRAPLPFGRRLCLEISMPPAVDVSFVYGLPALLADYGLSARPATRDEVEELTAMFFRPEV